MSHECEDCGEVFETLTEKRLHECDSDPGEATSDSGYDESLADYRERIEDGEFDALSDALATFETAQETAHEADAEAYRDRFQTYFEPFADGLDRFAREEGWPALEEFVEAYDPRADAFPHVSGVIENAVGRFIVRTRLEDGVDAIPADALVYLRAVPAACPSGAHVASEEAAAYGWGIGHGEEPVADHLQEMADEHYYWVSTAIGSAVYADQAAAVELVSRIVTDETISFRVSHPRMTIGPTPFFLSAAVAPEVGHAPTVPRHLDWESEHGYTFQWDPEVKSELRDLARETDAVESLPEDWTIADLAI